MTGRAAAPASRRAQQIFDQPFSNATQPSTVGTVRKFPSKLRLVAQVLHPTAKSPAAAEACQPHTRCRQPQTRRTITRANAAAAAAAGLAGGSSRRRPPRPSGCTEKDAVSKAKSRATVAGLLCLAGYLLQNFTAGGDRLIARCVTRPQGDVPFGESRIGAAGGRPALAIAAGRISSSTSMLPRAALLMDPQGQTAKVLLHTIFPRIPICAATQVELRRALSCLHQVPTLS
eukprot:364709-Chlamydomonas_euryale.AAC.4